MSRDDYQDGFIQGVQYCKDELLEWLDTQDTDSPAFLEKLIDLLESA